MRKSLQDDKMGYLGANSAEAVPLSALRWYHLQRYWQIASHKLMGYTYNPENDCVQKYHKCICPWDELDEMTQSYDCNVVDTTIKMAYKKVK